MVGYCLNSQEIRDKLADGSIVSSGDVEKRIQPASFDPIIGNDIFILETETGGLFRPKKDEEVYRTLLQLPKRQRQKRSTENFEIKKGFTYLIPLEDRLILSQEETIKSSPKSSIGRLFLNTRMLADYNPNFDEIRDNYKRDTELMLWLLVQPLAFNTIIKPGLSLNQLRFFQGLDAQLTNAELAEELKENKIIYERMSDGELRALNPILNDGIQVHLDLTGRNTEGVTALRARHNPDPIDLSKTEHYQAEDFFEPIVNRDGKIKIEKGEHYLFCSKEVLQIPPHLSAELGKTSNIGLRGDIHFAGFVDPGFGGDLVFEVKSDEPNDVILTDESIPLSSIRLFRNKKPDKLYGKDIGSHYFGQLGPKSSKVFRSFNYPYAARNIGKLSRSVLVQDANILNQIRQTKEGFEPISKDSISKLEKVIKDGFFHSRYDCEIGDEAVLQIIPYIIIFDKDLNVFSYVRASNIQDYGDERLFGKHSIGVGGHISSLDKPEFLKNGINRELKEEVEIIDQEDPRLVGTLMAYNTPVDKVHFGLVYTLNCQQVSPKESSIMSGRTLPIEELTNDKDYQKRYETWSNILIPHLPLLKELVRKSS